MTIIAGMFNSEADLGNVLHAIYEDGVESDDVTLMRGHESNDTVHTLMEEGFPVIPARGMSGAIGGVTDKQPMVAAYPTGVIDDLSLDNQEMAYFRKAAHDGAIILFINLDDVDADSIEKIMRKHQATRVDRLQMDTMP